MGAQVSVMSDLEMGRPRVLAHWLGSNTDLPRNNFRQISCSVTLVTAPPSRAIR